MKISLFQDCNNARLQLYTDEQHSLANIYIYLVAVFARIGSLNLLQSKNNFSLVCFACKRGLSFPDIFYELFDFVKCSLLSLYHVMISPKY